MPRDRRARHMLHSGRSFVRKAVRRRQISGVKPQRRPRCRFLFGERGGAGKELDQSSKTLFKFANGLASADRAVELVFGKPLFSQTATVASSSPQRSRSLVGGQIELFSFLAKEPAKRSCRNIRPRSFSNENLTF